MDGLLMPANDIRNSPPDVSFKPAGTGFYTAPGCVQCSKPADKNRKYGKATTGPLRGMRGWLCSRCQVK